MTEFATIKIERHRDPEGHPTCCREWGKQQCRFMGARKFGLIDVCMLDGVDLMRGAHGARLGDIATSPAEGWVRPATGCPVWRGEAA